MISLLLCNPCDNDASFSEYAGQLIHSGLSLGFFPVHRKERTGEEKKQ